MLKAECRSTGQHRSYLRIRLIIGLALDFGFRAWLALDRRACRAGLWIRTLHNRAPRTRARGTIANLARLGTSCNARGAFWYGRFQDIVRHVGKGRALGFQHIFGKVGRSRAGGNGRTQDPFGRVWTGARLVRSRTAPSSSWSIHIVGRRFYRNIHYDVGGRSKVIKPFFGRNGHSFSYIKSNSNANKQNSNHKSNAF